MKTFVISLPESKDRQAWIANHLGERGLPYEIIDAVDGRNMSVKDHPVYDGVKRRLFFGTDLKGGELGCLLSHIRCYQKIIDDNLDMALVFEDDVQLDKDFASVLAYVQEHTDKFEIMRFLGSKKVMERGGRRVFEVCDGYHAVRLPTTPGGAHATLLTRNGAEKMLRHLKKTAYPIDTMLGRSWQTKANVVALYPGLATHKSMDFGSLIDESRFKKRADLQGFEKFLFPFTRSFHKLEEAVGKKYWYYLGQ